RRRIGKDITNNQRLELAEQIRADAMLRHILAKNNQRFDPAGFDVAGDFSEVAPDLGKANLGQPRTIGVRVFIRAYQKLVALAKTRDGITGGTELGLQFCQE